MFRSGGLGDLDFLTGDLGGLQVSSLPASRMLSSLTGYSNHFSFFLSSPPPPPLFLLQLSGGMVGQNPLGGGFQQPGVSLGGGFQQPGVSLGGGFQQPGVSLGGGGLGLDLFSGVSTQAPTSFSLPKTVSCLSPSHPHTLHHATSCSLYCVLQEWLSAAKGKGLQIMGTFVRRNGQIYADMDLTNKALQPMGNFAIQFNKNR